MVFGRKMSESECSSDKVVVFVIVVLVSPCLL
jgi:hypothetical protein